ncbi:hypothetical protein Bca4012_062045 [Brassica carinata]
MITRNRTARNCSVTILNLRFVLHHTPTKYSFHIWESKAACVFFCYNFSLGKIILEGAVETFKRLHLRFSKLVKLLCPLFLRTLNQYGRIRKEIVKLSAVSLVTSLSCSFFVSCHVIMLRSINLRKVMCPSVKIALLVVMIWVLRVAGQIMISYKNGFLGTLSFACIVVVIMSKEVSAFAYARN